jgi:PilZ domain
MALRSHGTRGAREGYYKCMVIDMSLTTKPIATETVTAKPKDRLLRRSNSRQPFTASALVFEPKSEMLLRARTADLGSDGCFIDTLNPFAKGTAVKVRIEKKGASFEASARVVYSLDSMGMGLAFNPVGPEQLWVLHEWLGEAGGAVAPEVALPAIKGEISSKDLAAEARTKDVHCEALNEIIQELMGRELISREKGEAILRKLSRCPESE